MSIRLRLTIVIVLAAGISLMSVGLLSLFNLQQMSDLSIEQSKQALIEQGERAIWQTAESVADQIELYLDLHPEIDLTDAAQLESNAALAEIAVQPVGETGYTAVFDDQAVTHFHVNPAIVGTNMSTLADERPQFWAIFEASLDGSPSAGYYDWQDADGQIRDKYMGVVPVGATALRVAATTYIDEFYQPVGELESQLTDAQETARIQLFLVLLTFTVLVLLSASILGRQLSRPVLQITEAAALVAAGGLSPDQGERTISQTAESVAGQIELYLHSHPEIDPTDAAQLESDAALAEMAVQSVGATGYTAVFDDRAVIHFHPDPDVVGTDMSTLADERPQFWAIFEASLDGSPSAGYYDWQDVDGQMRAKYMSVVPVGATALRVASTTYIDEFYQLDLEERNDEIGDLAHAFNTMIARIHNLFTSLEARGAELSQRAEQLEESSRQNQRRSTQLEASAQIARAVASVLDPDQLSDQVVHLVCEHFGHYHVGLFLLDESDRWAVLQAASSEGGQRMLARGHRLAVGAQSIVGIAIHSGQPRVALKAGVDAIYFDNPDLPDTRSQIALPLIARGQIIGALDAQSSAADAFDTEEVAVLSALADQIAVALDNARLYEASQAALVQMQVLQRQYTGETWSQHGARRESDFFEYRPAGLVEEATAPSDGPPAGADELLELEKALAQGSTAVTSDDNEQGTALVAPIKVRGQVIGALGLQDQEQGRAWSDEEITLVETIADQVAQAMEAARLFDETQRRAQRERRVGEIATKIRAAADIDGILRTTVQEIRRALGVSHGIIRLGTETHLQPPADSGPEGGHGDE